MNPTIFRNLKKGQKLRNTLTNNIFVIDERVEVFGEVQYKVSRKRVNNSDVIVTASCSSNWVLIEVDKIFHLHSCHIPDCGICAMAFTERTES
ncbi:MAG: hypothetical protein KAR20_18070 [Candidatus Heimdallarchaeota archaeon]|nr:hypothetical protein [Candidatus Heimdallarchaeota archaeon]